MLTDNQSLGLLQTIAKLEDAALLLPERAEAARKALAAGEDELIAYLLEVDVEDVRRVSKRLA